MLLRTTLRHVPWLSKKLFRESKVNHLDRCVRSTILKHDILKLQIAMHNGVIVHVIDCRQQRGHVPGRLSFRVGRARVQIAAVAEFEDEENLLLVRVQLVRLDNVGVIHGAENVDYTWSE